MPIDLDSPVMKLIRQTKRYAICDIGSGQFEVSDQRHLLDRLLQLPDLRPTTDDWLQAEFEEALEALSPGPTLTLDDDAMLGWLTTTVEVLDPEEKNKAFNAAYQAAVVFKGTLDQVEYFIRAALDQRVQPTRPNLPA